MSNPATPILQVAAKAVITNSTGQVLIVREAETGPNNTQIGWWGLPGGRIEPGESFADGLQREAFEETGLRVTPVRSLYVGEWRPTIRGQQYQVIAIFMLCRADAAQVIVSEEHDEFRWILPKDRHIYRFMDPDDKVIDSIQG